MMSGADEWRSLIAAQGCGEAEKARHSRLSCTEIRGVPDARVTILAKEIHEHHACTT